MKIKLLVNLLIGLNVSFISSNTFASFKEDLNSISLTPISLDSKSSPDTINDKSCEKNNIIYFNRTIINKKIIELCKWGDAGYRYRYGKLDNPEIVLYSKEVTREDVPLGGFSFIYKEYEYSVIIDKYKSTLAVYKNDDILTQIYLSEETQGYVNKTLTDLPEKVY